MNAISFTESAALARTALASSSSYSPVSTLPPHPIARTQPLRLRRRSKRFFVVQNPDPTSPPDALTLERDLPTIPPSSCASPPRLRTDPSLPTPVIKPAPLSPPDHSSVPPGPISPLLDHITLPLPPAPPSSPASAIPAPAFSPSARKIFRSPRSPPSHILFRPIPLTHSRSKLVAPSSCSKLSSPSASQALALSRIAEDPTSQYYIPPLAFSPVRLGSFASLRNLDVLGSPSRLRKRKAPPGIGGGESEPADGASAVSDAIQATLSGDARRDAMLIDAARVAALTDTQRLPGSDEPEPSSVSEPSTISDAVLGGIVGRAADAALARRARGYKRVRLISSAYDASTTERMVSEAGGKASGLSRRRSLRRRKQARVRAAPG